MAGLTYTTWEIYLADGDVAIVRQVSRYSIGDGVLHLFYRGGMGADEQHIISIPVVNIKYWTRSGEAGDHVAIGKPQMVSEARG